MNKLINPLNLGIIIFLSLYVISGYGKITDFEKHL